MSQIHVVIALLLCCASAASATRPALRTRGTQRQRADASKSADQGELSRDLLGANAATAETAATASTDNDPETALSSSAGAGLSGADVSGLGTQDAAAAGSGAADLGSRAAAASAWRSVQRGVISWARHQSAGSSAKTRSRGGPRPRRELPGAIWSLHPLVGGGEDAGATEFQDGEELERTGKAEGQLRATALAAVDQKPYNAQDYAAQRAAAWERAVIGSE